MVKSEIEKQIKQEEFEIVHSKILLNSFNTVNPIKVYKKIRQHRLNILSLKQKLKNASSK